MRSIITDEHILKMSAKKTPYFKKIHRIKLRIDKSVYPTGKIGKLFYKALSLPTMKLNNKMVLDYGTGTGFLVIAAALKGARVIAIDQNPVAIKCAKYNAKQNKIDHFIDFRVAHNLSAILPGEKFDLILAGLPWESAIPKTPLEMAFYDARFSMRKALSKRAKILLNKNGTILLSYSQRMQHNTPIQLFFQGYQITVLLETIINDEPHYILRLKPC